MSILLISIVYFVIQITLFTDIKFYLDIIINSEKRGLEMFKTNALIFDISHLNENITEPQNFIKPTKNESVLWFNDLFIKSAKTMKTAQNDLSYQITSLSK